MSHEVEGDVAGRGRAGDPVPVVTTIELKG
jgi:hypothetical protein